MSRCTGMPVSHPLPRLTPTCLPAAQGIEVRNGERVGFNTDIYRCACLQRASFSASRTRNTLLLIPQ